MNKQGLSKKFKILGCFLCTKNKKKKVNLQEGIVPFILREAVVSTVIGKLMHVFLL